MKKDVVLFVNAIRPATFSAMQSYEARTGRSFTPVVIVDKHIQQSITKRNGQNRLKQDVLTISADFDSPQSVIKALAPYKDRIFAVTSQYENSILELKKLVPYLPYLPTPSERSLEWATEKKHMRTFMEAHDASLVPGYIEVSDAKEETIKKIEQKLTYPVIVKPSGLEGSLLVTLVANSDELKRTLAFTFQEIQKAYDTWIKRQKPVVLVEEFMDGDMYSVDTYVAHDGTCYHTPPVKVITGKRAGFEDFFGYMRVSPSGLDDQEVSAAQATAAKAAQALGLRSVTAHVELMRLPTGWKVIELGPRCGGYRHDIYNLSYGINHIMNDIRNRAGEEPEIPAKLLRHVVVFNIYAREEGILESVDGIEEVEQLASFTSLKQTIYPGEAVRFARNNGDPVFEIILSHEDQKQFEQDVRSLEEVLNLHVTTVRARTSAPVSSAR